MRIVVSDLLPFSFIAVFLILEALFSGGEIALIAADINRIRHKAKSGSRSAAVTLKLLDKPEWFLSTTSAGTNLCVVTNTALATSLFISMLGTARGEVASVMVMIPLILIVGEIVPKSIFQKHPEAVALKVSWFLWLASFILYPVVFVVSWISRGALNIFSRGEKKLYYMSYITKSGLEFVLRREEENSDIMKSEKEIIQRIFDFTESTVEEVMVPISNVAVLSIDTLLQKGARLVTEKGYSRIPVFRDQVYNIVGVLHSFDVLQTLYGSKIGIRDLSEDESIEKCVRSDVLFVPETKPTDELLVELQQRGEHMAIIVNEYGGAVGIVTIEDILEEIVGEIEDEYSEEGEMLCRRVGPGKYLFDAATKIDMVKDILSREIPEGDYETLGGYLLFKIGKIPERGESFRDKDILFIIEEVDMRSIREVMVVLPE